MPQTRRVYFTVIDVSRVASCQSTVVLNSAACPK